VGLIGSGLIFRFFEIFLGAVDFLYYENEGLFIFVLFSLLGS
jgi:hypothetical protein